MTRDELRTKLEIIAYHGSKADAIKAIQAAAKAAGLSWPDYVMSGGNSVEIQNKPQEVGELSYYERALEELNESVGSDYKRNVGIVIARYSWDGTDPEGHMKKSPEWARAYVDEIKNCIPSLRISGESEAGVKTLQMVVDCFRRCVKLKIAGSTTGAVK